MPPERNTPVDLAHDWVQSRVRQRLRDLDVTTNDLADACGDAESTWRAKINGGRSFRLADLLAINMAVDAELFNALPFGAADLRAFFAPEYRGRLSHSKVGAGMPTLADPSADWAGVATRVVGWLEIERPSGRLRLLTADGLAHSVLTLADDDVLPSTSSTIAARTDTRVEISWIVQDVHLRVEVPWTPRQGEPDAEESRWVLRQFGEAINALSLKQAKSKMLVSVLPQAMASAATVALPALGATAAREWFTISPSEFHTLYGSLDAPDLPIDCQARKVLCAPAAGLIWLEVK